MNNVAPADTRRDRWTEAVLGSVSAGLMVVDRAGYVLFVNPAGERILRRAQGDIRGRPYQAVLRVVGNRDLLVPAPTRSAPPSTSRDDVADIIRGVDRADRLIGDILNLAQPLRLATCRHIVERHGGRISVASSPGAGTSVRLRLPVVRPESDEADPLEAPPRP